MSEPNVYKVKLADGQVISIKVDANLPASMLSTVIEGSVRAKTRMNKMEAGLKTQEGLGTADTVKPAPTMREMFKPDSVVSTLKNLASGLVSPIKGMGSEFMQGLKMINQDPGGAVGLLPELVKAPMRNAVDSMNRAKHLPESDQIGKLAEEVNAIPIIGPLATSIGERAGKGDVAGAVGSDISNSILLYLAGKGGGKALNNVIGKMGEGGAGTGGAAAPVTTPPPTPTPPVYTPGAGPAIDASSAQAADVGATRRYTGPATSQPLPTGERVPTLPTGQSTHNLKANLAAEQGRPAIPNTINLEQVDMSTAMENLRKNLQAEMEAAKASKVTTATATPSTTATASAPPSSPLRVRLPIRVGGIPLPVSIELSGTSIDAVKRFLSTAKGSAAETFWGQRLLRHAVPQQEQ